MAGLLNGSEETLMGHPCTVVHTKTAVTRVSVVPNLISSTRNFEGVEWV